MRRYDNLASESPTTVAFDDVILDDAAIRETELLRARRSLPYLRDRIGNEGMRTVLDDDHRAVNKQVLSWLDRSDGRWRSGSLLLRGPRPPVGRFRAWFSGNPARRNGLVFAAAHPEMAGHGVAAVEEQQ
ncbi:hypothetical protein ACQP1G_15255 [Nocardia sp. CA-107356]|uniref:hypothetical protein n=1 Tax=Nocardia sp. CA-107356 TaxID=3239972 RepID=UPI003D8BA0E1